MRDTKTPAAPSAVTPAVASRPAQRAGHATTANLLKAGMVVGAARLRLTPPKE
jgi:hypothetical protein